MKYINEATIPSLLLTISLYFPFMSCVPSSLIPNVISLSSTTFPSKLLLNCGDYAEDGMVLAFI